MNSPARSASSFITAVSWPAYRVAGWSAPNAPDTRRQPTAAITRPAAALSIRPRHLQRAFGKAGIFPEVVQRAGRDSHGDSPDVSAVCRWLLEVVTLPRREHSDQYPHENDRVE